MSDATKNLKNARKKAGLTQKDVEQLLELRPLLIKDFETGRLKVPSDMVLKLAKLYHVTIDELLGADNEELSRRDLSSIKSLWSTSPEQKILLDPIVVKEIGTSKLEVGTKPLLSLLLKKLKKSEQKKYIEEMVKFINSLIGIDGKIKPDEVQLRNDLLQHFSTFSKNKSLNTYLTEPYRPKTVDIVHEREALKHFLVWVLFFIASVDKEIDYRELEYIEKSAENIKLKKKNFEFIYSFFNKESYE